MIMHNPLISVNLLPKFILSRLGSAHGNWLCAWMLRHRPSVVRQATAERLSGHEEHESQAGRAAFTQVPGFDPSVRAKLGQGAGRYVKIMRRHHWDLSSVQKERLHQYLAQSPG
ncbi:MAG: hypothetical protein L0H54_10040 [Alcaligenaceae bacterium]|nr:hypothetical protein [Alcaligenaceae bacterium]